MVNQAVKLGATPTSPGSLSCSLSASMLALPPGAVMPFLSGASVSSASLALLCHTLLSASPRELAAHVMHPKVFVYDSDVYTLHVCDDRPGVLAASATVPSSSRLHLPSRCSWLEERHPLVPTVWLFTAMVYTGVVQSSGGHWRGKVGPEGGRTHSRPSSADLFVGPRDE